MARARRRSASKGSRRPRPRAKPLRAPAGEETLWKVQESTALAAIAFWDRFLSLRMGAANEKPLDDAALQRLAAIVRAVSWVESKHGTATTNQGVRDPMQCGHPRDAWWQQVISVGGPGQDRFITGPGGSNFWAGDLPEAAEAASGFPAAAHVSGLGNPTLGHDDPAFNPALSYFWAVPILVHKINTTAGAQTFKCGDLGRERLIDGAVAYNGGGDPEYGRKIVEALALFGGLPIRPAAKRAAPASPAPGIPQLVRTVASVLARASRGSRPARIRSARLTFTASYAVDTWFAGRTAGADADGTIEMTITAPFADEADVGDDTDPVIDAIAALLDDLGETAATVSFAIQLPLALGWRDGSVTISLTTPETATHLLHLVVDREVSQ